MATSDERRRNEEREITIDEYKAIAIALFDVSLLEASRMTMYEYKMRMFAYEIKRQKDMEKISISAWLNNQAKATKQIGKKQIPYFKKFENFYNSEKQFNLIIFGKDEKQIARRMSIAELNRKLNKKKGGENG